MSLFLAILSLLTALLPLADRGIQTYDHYRQLKPAHVVQEASAQVVIPPEVGQPNVVFHNGQWWKFENGHWFVWRQNPQYVAQGGDFNVRR